MIQLTLDTTVIALGPLAVHWFGLFLLGGLAAGLATAARAGVPRRTLLFLASWAVPCGLLGARLVHLLDGWAFYAEEPDQLLALHQGGLSLWGALLAGGAAALIAARRAGLDAPWLADRLTPAALLGEAVGRIGTFLGGDGVGAPTLLPWGVVYRHNSALSPDFDLPRHPVQLYLALFALALALVLRRWPTAPPGRRALAGLTLYGAGRLLLGFLAAPAPLLLGLSQAQAIGLALFLAAGTLLAYSLLQERVKRLAEVR